MAKSLQDFLSQIRDKGVRTTNQFQLEVSSGYADVDEALENVTLWCTTAEVPSRTIEYADVFYQGYPLKYPSTTIMEQEHVLTIKSDNAGDIRKAFLAWQNKVSNMAISQGSTLGGDKRISANSFVRMHMLAEDMETITETYKLIGVGCSIVGPLSMSNEAVDIATFDCTLISQHHELENNEGAFPDLF